MNTLLFYLKYSLMIFIIATTTACTSSGGDDTPAPTTPTDPANPAPTTPTAPTNPAPATPPEPTTPTSPVGQLTIIDNTDIGFSTTGTTWTTSTATTGFLGTDYSPAPAGTGASTATWKFTIDTAGYYVISAQWTADTNRASNAPYQILNNGVVVADIIVDQKLSGGKLIIIKSITLEVGTVEIVLTDKADGVVVADAIQLAYIISQPVATTPDGMTIDNGKPGYSTTGNWNNSKSTPGYYGNNYQSTVQTGTATWRFTVTTPGYYEVFANWTSYTNRETIVPYDIVSTSSSLNTRVIMDQTQNGGKFNSLGVFELVAGNLDIILTSSSTGKAVIADAVRICPYGSCSYQSISSPYKNKFFGKDSVTVDVNVLNLQNGWGVEFILDGDEVASSKSYTPPFKQTYTALTKATHTVETYLINSNGSRLLKYYDSVTFDVGDSHVAFGDSTTFGAGDNQQSDNTSLDGRIKGGGYVPILNNKLTSLKGYPHFIVNKGFPGFKSSDSLLKIDTVLTENPDAQLFLILLGNNDSIAKVASGLGLTSGQAGYAGTYKDNMDKIITAIKAAGKTPYLAKIPYTTVPAYNTFILDYNKVIDELVTLHSITLTPPDLYTYFETNPNQLADTVHPNGIGYQALADIWATALTTP